LPIAHAMIDVPLSLIAYFAHLAATSVGVISIFWLIRDSAISKWTTGLLAVGCIALAVASFSVSDPSPYHPFADFHNAYYPAGLAVLHNPVTVRTLTSGVVFGFVNMPIVAYLFAPLSALGLQYAISLFTIVGLGATVGAWLLLARLAKLGLRERWLLLLLFAANGPLLYSIKEGNTSHLILFTLAAGLALLHSNRRLAAGALLGAAAIIKPPLVLFAIFFALRRDMRGFAAFAGMCVAVTALSVALFGWHDNLHWFQLCIVQFSHQWLAAFNVQSIPSFLLRLRVGPDRLKAGMPIPHNRTYGNLHDSLLGYSFLLPPRPGSGALYTHGNAGAPSDGKPFSTFSSFVLSWWQALCPGPTIILGSSCPRRFSSDQSHPFTVRIWRAVLAGSRYSLLRHLYGLWHSLIPA
jgi:hypothetical protein